MADLKRVYAAPTEEVALAELESFDGKWSRKYPKIAKWWKDNWANLSTYFKYPEAVRRLIAPDLYNQDLTVNYGKSQNPGPYSRPMTAC